MSVLAHSPVHAKRHYEEAEGVDSFDRHAAHCAAPKRARHQPSPGLGRCGQFAGSPGFSGVPPSTVAALLALFPGMDDRTVTAVLSECGTNIDAAIKRLGELRLSGQVRSASAEHDHQTEAAAGPSSLGPGTPPGDRSLTPGAIDVGAPSPSGIPPGPQTAEQWVEFLVTGMAAAKDMDDAKSKAAGCLQRFEGFVTRIVKEQASGDAARLAKLSEENGVLKRAVQIQHRQLQERSGLEAENAQLKQLLAQYQEQLRTLEVSNYSLAMHLQKATSASMMHSPRNPDVF